MSTEHKHTPVKWHRLHECHLDQLGVASYEGEVILVDPSKDVGEDGRFYFNAQQWFDAGQIESMPFYSPDASFCEYLERPSEEKRPSSPIGHCGLLTAAKGIAEYMPTPILSHLPDKFQVEFPAEAVVKFMKAIALATGKEGA